MDGFKADFIQYLRDNNLLERVDLNKNDANINAQKYDDQLKGFLQDYKVDENELIEASIDIDEILSMDFDDIANVEVNDNDIAQGKDVIGGLFNFLINQNDIKAQVDKNGDGKFTKDEISEFAKTVASKDGDDSNFSLKDMLGSYQQMNDKTFQVGDFSAIGNGLIENIVADNPKGANPPKAPVSTEIRPENSATITEESLKNDDETQLREKQEQQQEIAEQSNQNAQAALNGTNGAVQPPNSAVEDAYASYMAQVEKVSNDENKFAEQLSQKNTEITNKQNELHNWQMQAELENQECMKLDVEVDDAKNAFDSAQQATASVEASLNSLTKPSALAPSSQRQKYESQKASLQSQLASAKQEETKAKEELEKKEKEYEDAVDKYNNTLGEVERTQGELETLNSELLTLQSDIAKASAQNQAELQKLANTWNTTKANNEASRQQNFENFSQTAQTATSNLAVINEAISNLPSEEA